MSPRQNECNPTGRQSGLKTGLDVELELELL